MSNVLEADYSVPHCNFQRNNDGGFTVTFRRPPLIYFVALLPAILFVSFILGVIAWLSYFGFIGFIAFLVIFGAGIGIAYYTNLHFGKLTTITTDPDFVTVNGKKMRREDFGTFHAYESQTITRGKTKTTLHTLGYQFANRSYPCGGKWFYERQMTEAAAALNSYLMKTPQRGDVHSPSPEQIHGERPMKF